MEIGTWVWPCVFSQPGEERGESFACCLGPDRIASGTAPRRGARAQVAGLARAPPVPSQNKASSRARSVPPTPHASGREGPARDVGLGVLGWVCAGRAGGPTEESRSGSWGWWSFEPQRPGFPERPSCLAPFQIYMAGRKLVQIEAVTACSSPILCEGCPWQQSLFLLGWGPVSGRSELKQAWK